MATGDLRRVGNVVLKLARSGVWVHHAYWTKGSWYRPTVDTCGNEEWDTVSIEEAQQLDQVKPS